MSVLLVAATLAPSAVVAALTAALGSDDDADGGVGGGNGGYGGASPSGAGDPDLGGHSDVSGPGHGAVLPLATAVVAGPVVTFLLP